MVQRFNNIVFGFEVRIVSKIEYNKLVRDYIPQIISDSGKKCNVAVLSEADYQSALERKMEEEIAEYRESHELEELADLMEVIIAAAEAQGYSLEELDAARIKKKISRGGFSQRILLKSVSEDI